MTYPLTPHESIKATLRKRIVYTGLRQKKPYNLNTPARWDIREDLTEAVVGYPIDNWPGMWSGAGSVSLYNETRNQAYNRFVNKLGDASQLGATATAERRKTCEMVTDIILRILKSAKLASRGRFMESFHVLGFPVQEKTIRTVRYRKVTKTGTLKRRKVRKGKRYVSYKRVYRMPNGREVAHTVAGGWLVWSYGVKPLQQDIYNLLDVLQRPLPYFTDVKVSATNQESQSPSPPDAAAFTHRLSVRYSAKVSVANPDLWLLNRLGLVNPAQWLLEGIQFSFVVDWFSNLSNVVNSWTDLVGLDITDPCVSERLETNEQKSISYGYYGPVVLTRYKRVYLQRLPGTIPKPVLQFAWERVDWQRGANAISLIIALLLGRKA